MEMLAFGHAGLPTLVFPTSCGPFYEFGDRGMVHSVHDKIDQGHLQLVCVDSLDSESWYNRAVPPRWRIARHMQYEQYLLLEVLPFINQQRHSSCLAALGCSFGGYHAANIALRHPDIFTAFLSMGGAFDLSNFLSGYYNQDCYFNLPIHYLSNTHDPWYLNRYMRNAYVLATGAHDQCWNEKERLAQIMHDKGILCRLDVWGDNTGHDWPAWQRMLQTYLYRRT